MQLIKTMLAATVLSLFAISAQARDMIVGLSPHNTPEAQMQIVRELVATLSEHVERGEEAHIVDAATQALIASFVVPDRSAFEQPKAKLKVNRIAIKALARFAQESQADPDRIGQIDLPAFLRHIGETWPADTQGDILVLGSPIFDDPRAPAFSMLDIRVPGDGNIGVSRDVSPYGALGQDGRLSGYTVYFGTLGNGWAVDDRYAYFVERFWSLNIAARGGRLAALTADLPTILAQVKSGRTVADMHSLVPTDKLEMIEIRPTTTTPGTAQDASAATNPAATPIFERPVQVVPLPANQAGAAHEVELGISWSCETCDLDIYVRPGSDRDVIYFGNKRTENGELFKDYLKSPSLTNGYETVSFTAPLDLSDVMIAVNFYGGQAVDGVQGEVRLSIGTQTWAKPFRVKSPIGTAGLGRRNTLAAGRAANAAWTVIDPLEIVGLR